MWEFVAGLWPFALVILVVLAFFSLGSIKNEALRSRVQRGVLALLLFGLTLVGIVSMLGGIWEAVHGRMDAIHLVAQLAVGLVLIAGGTIPLWALLFSRAAKARLLKRRQACHPEAPWMWEAEWSTGRMAYSDRRAVTLVWFVLLVMTGALAGISYLNRAAIAEQLNVSWLAVTGFYTIYGLLLLLGYAAGAKLLRSYLQFGRSVFELSSPFGVVGGQLAGNIHTRMREVPPAGVELTVSCRRLDATSPTADVGAGTAVWQSHLTVQPSQVALGADGAVIPVAFAIPADAPESDAWSPDRRIAWTLRARASVPGLIPYDCAFAVPVFRAAPSPRHRPAGQ